MVRKKERKESVSENECWEDQKVKKKKKKGKASLLILNKGDVRYQRFYFEINTHASNARQLLTTIDRKGRKKSTPLCMCLFYMF